MGDGPCSTSYTIPVLFDLISSRAENSTFAAYCISSSPLMPNYSFSTSHVNTSTTPSNNSMKGKISTLLPANFRCCGSHMKDFGFENILGKWYSIRCSGFVNFCSISFVYLILLCLHQPTCTISKYPTTTFSSTGTRIM